MDLRKYIEQIKEIGGLREVDGADRDLEIGALTEMVGEKDGPALLFDQINGFPKGYRIISNFINNSKHLNTAFGFPPDLDTLGLVRSIKEKFSQLQPIPPQEVSSGPVLENVQEGEDISSIFRPRNGMKRMVDATWAPGVW